MHADALSILPLGAIEVERQRRESSGKWMVRADEGTVPIMIADRTNSAAPKLAGEIDIERFPAARTGMRANGSICVRVRGGAFLSGIAAPNRRSILIRTHQLAVAVVRAAVVVVVAVVIGRAGGGRADCADCCGAVGRTSRVIPSGITGDRTTRAAGIPVSAPGVDASGAASDVGDSRAAAMKSSTAATASATTASARQSVIWNQTGGHQNGRCEPDQTVPNHGIPPNAGVPYATDGFQQ